MATRQIQLTMDETVLPRVVEALGGLHGYTMRSGASRA